MNTAINSVSISDPSAAHAQIVQLKRLLVTLKQQSEKIQGELNLRVEVEKNKNTELERELGSLQSKHKEDKKAHEEELLALREQMRALRETHKKLQEEFKSRDQTLEATPEYLANQALIESLQNEIESFKKRTEEAASELRQLHKSLEKSQKRIRELEEEISRKNFVEFQHSQATLNDHQDLPDVIASQTSSYHLKQEIDSIKTTLIQGALDSKNLESRYSEIFDEKLTLEHQYRHLQTQFEHQSSNLAEFQSQLHTLLEQKKSLETTLQHSNTVLITQKDDIEQLNGSLSQQVQKGKERDTLQEKYELLKEEWISLSRKLEEALDSRIVAESQVISLHTVLKDFEQKLNEKEALLNRSLSEKEILEEKFEGLRIGLEESESRLKMAQQHLAKKVKEAAFLTEKIDDQRINLEEAIHTTEIFKGQVTHLQASIEIYQKQEKRLQDQLHDALKGTDGQVAKWEEKYFQMYEKWQESETKIRDLRKYEEKHQQMQSLLSNLGNFMGTPSYSNNAHLFHSIPEQTDKINRSFSHSQDQPTDIPLSHLNSDEKIDLFGMKASHDKIKNPPLL